MIAPRDKAKRVRVLLVDDHPLVREGIKASLIRSRSIDVIGEASDGAEAVVKTKTLSPDVVVLDLDMPGTSGRAVLESLRELSDTKVVVLTVHDARQHAASVADRGARGFVQKDAPPSTLIDAIEVVYRGGEYFADDDVRRADSGVPPRRPLLTPRETQVLRLVADGYTSRQIGDELGVSTRTIETYRERIMEKLKIRSVAGLTKYALSQGLVG